MNDECNDKQQPHVNENNALNNAGGVKYKAFVVMNGNRKKQTISNNMKSVVITNEDHEDDEYSKEAIILSHVSNKIISKNDDGLSKEVFC